MQTVDWAKYAYILVSLQAKNEVYRMVTHFSDKVFDHVRGFDKESREAIMNAQNRTLEKASELQKEGVSPESEQGQALAKDFWDMVMEFTKGDNSLLPELIKFSENWENSEWKSNREFIEKALEIYHTSIGANPFKEIDGK